MNNGYYPYNTQKSPAINQSLETKGQEAKYREEELRQKAPETLPFELDNIVSVIGNTFVSLTELRRMLNNAKQSAIINDEGVAKIQKKIDTINRMLLDISEDLSTISLSKSTK